MKILFTVLFLKLFLRGFFRFLIMFYCIGIFAAHGNLGSLCRYTAVVMPVLYNTTHRSRKRVFMMIAVVWVLAFAVSCPLLFGFNTTGQINSFRCHREVVSTQFTPGATHSAISCHKNPFITSTVQLYMLGNVLNVATVTRPGSVLRAGWVWPAGHMLDAPGRRMNCRN